MTELVRKLREEEEKEAKRLEDVEWQRRKDKWLRDHEDRRYQPPDLEHVQEINIPDKNNANPNPSASNGPDLATPVSGDPSTSLHLHPRHPHHHPTHIDIIWPEFNGWTRAITSWRIQAAVVPQRRRRRLRRRGLGRGRAPKAAAIGRPPSSIENIALRKNRMRVSSCCGSGEPGRKWTPRKRARTPPPSPPRARRIPPFYQPLKEAEESEGNSSKEDVHIPSKLKVETQVDDHLITPMPHAESPAPNAKVFIPSLPPPPPGLPLTSHPFYRKMRERRSWLH